MSGDYARPDYLIEPEELARRLEAGEVRVFDGTVFLEPASQGYRARSGREEYLAAHLPGSAFVDQLTPNLLAAMPPVAWARRWKRSMPSAVASAAMSLLMVATS